MTIMMRMTRLFKADMHGLLDLLEEPEAVLKQAIRDMETEIEQGEQALAGRLQKIETWRGTVAHVEREIATLEGQIDTAFEAQNEALARTFIRKKLETDKRLADILRAIDELTSETDAMQHKIRDQKAQLDTIVADMSRHAGAHPGSRPPAGSASSGSVSEEDIEAAFLREQRRRADSAGRD